MRRNFEGVILKAVPQSSSSYVVTLFTLQFGKLSGLVRVGRKNIADIQPGNLVEGEQFKRLESQLGSITLNCHMVPSARCFGDEQRLQFLHYLVEVLYKGLGEEEVHAHLYRATKDILATIEQPGLWDRLGFYELQILSSLGYGLSLSSETAVPCADNSPLMYVSPKSGRAVSAVMGEPYKNKLLKLPALFGGKSEDFLDVFRLTGHFLDQALHGRALKTREDLISLGENSNFKD